MKLILSVILIFAAAPVLASDYSRGFNDSGDVVVTYASWCEKDQVMIQGLLGELVVRDNCAEKGLVCKGQEFYRGRQYIHAASCVAE